MTDLKVEPAQDEDIYDIIPWIKKQHKQSYSALNLDVSEVVQNCKNFINDENCLTIVVKNDDEIVGFLGAFKGRHMFAPEQVGMILAFHVREDHRKDVKVVRTLLDTAEEWVKSNGMKHLFFSLPYREDSLNRLGYRSYEITYFKTME